MDEQAAFLRLAARFDELAEYMERNGDIPARAVWGSKEAYAYSRGRLDYRCTISKPAQRHLRRLETAAVGLPGQAGEEANGD